MDGLRDCLTDDLIAPLPPDPALGFLTQQGPTTPATPLPNENEADSMLELYHYSPLPTASSIRVLEVLQDPIARQGQNLLSCTFSYVDMHDEKTTYEALSYTWGCPRLVYRALNDGVEYNHAAAQRHPILCNGKVMLVAQNLFDALTQFSQRASLAPIIEKQVAQPLSRTIWIDALCINQQDMDERNAQVELMGEIYKNATTVLVWVGPRGWLTDTAMATFDTLQSIITNHRTELKSLAKVDIFNAKWFTERGLWHPGDWKGFYVWMQHAWFRRSWIVQEGRRGFKAVEYLAAGCAAEKSAGCEWSSPLLFGRVYRPCR